MFWIVTLYVTYLEQIPLPFGRLSFCFGEGLFLV